VERSQVVPRERKTQAEQHCNRGPGLGSLKHEIIAARLDAVGCAMHSRDRLCRRKIFSSMWTDLEQILIRYESRIAFHAVVEYGM
jgi:hypothetical protein